VTVIPNVDKPECLRLLSKHVNKTANCLMGGDSANEHWIFDAKYKGTGKLVFEYFRKGDTVPKKKKKYTFIVK